MSELKPCPFCGGSDIKCFLFDPFDGYQGDCSSYIVECKECGAEMQKRHKAEAINAWNRRVDNER